MRSIKNIVIVMLLSLAGCSYLDVVPDNITQLDHAFSDKYTAEQYLSTCYSHLPQGGGDSNPGLLGAAECILNREKENTAMGSQLARNLNNVSSPALNYWSGGNGGNNLYNGLRDCNVFLENVHKVKGLSTIECNRWIAEVKVLKAYFHFYLLRYYGPIHLIKENLPVYQNIQDIRQRREKIDDCFNYIVGLLDEAIESGALPGQIQDVSRELGRLTQPAAYALKAKVLVYFASPLFNGNRDYVDFLDHDGESFFNQVEDRSRWTVAAKACKEAIDVCLENGIRLYQKEDYKTTYNVTDSTKLNCALRNAFSEKWNPEIIWVNVRDNYGPLQLYAQAGLQEVTRSLIRSYMSPSMNTAEMFYSSNGIPIDEDLSYDYNNRYGLQFVEDKDKHYMQKGHLTAKLNFNREPRYYAYLGFDRGKWYGIGKLENDAETWHVEGKLKEYAAAFQPGEYSATGYWPKKIVSLKSGYESTTMYRYESYYFPEIRFTDLLLYYAEALNETKDVPDDEVYQVIDQVRARAGLKGIKESWLGYSKTPNKPDTKQGMRDIIRRERTIELTFENTYYWDVRRWKRGVAELNRPIKAWNVLSETVADYYTVKVYFQQKFALKDYFAPIPEWELIVNPLLIQNPGW